MAVKFHVIARRNPRDPDAPEKYYPSIQSNGRLDINDLAELIAEISTVSSTDTLAVLEALVTQVPRQMSMGNIVGLGDLGSFSVKIKSNGEDTEDEVSAKNIESVLPLFHPGKRFKEVLSRIKFVKDNGS